MHLTILGIVPDIYLGLYLTFLGRLSGYDTFPGIFLVAILLVRPLWFLGLQLRYGVRIKTVI